MFTKNGYTLTQQICRGIVLAAGLSSWAGAACAGDSVNTDSVFKIEARNSDGTSKSGSAVVIGPGLLVTNCHVTRGAATIDIVRAPNRWRATVRSGSNELDLCVLAAEGVNAPAPRIVQSGSLAVGDAVYAVGFPSGQGVTVRQGAIKGLHRYENSSVIQVSATFDFGASGGGLFDSSGNLIGVLTFKILGGDDYHFAVPTDWIARAQSNTPSARLVPAFWERTPGALPTFFDKIALELDAKRKGGMTGVGTQGSSR